MFRGVALCFLILPSFALAESREVELNAKGVPLFAPEETADYAAYDYQTQAAKKLKRVLRLRMGSSQEPRLRVRLASIYQRQAEVAFRIAHAEAYQEKRKLDLSLQKKSLRTSIQVLAPFFKKFANRPEAAQALALRANGYHELGKKKKAQEDYEQIVARYPQSEEFVSAHLALAQFADEKKDYQKSISHLNVVRKRSQEKKDGETLAYSYSKLAWAYYQIGKINRSFDFTQKLINLSHQLENPSASLSFKEMRRNILIDSTLFYLKGIGLKISNYTVQNALVTFKNLSQKDHKTFNEMIIRFTKLLRSHNYQKALSTWTSTLLQSSVYEPNAMLKILVLTLEDQVNKNLFLAMNQTSREAIQLLKKHPKEIDLSKEKDNLLKGAQKIHQLLKKEYSALRRKEATLGLIAIYKILVSGSKSKEPYVLQSQYNLAQAYAKIKKNKKAYQTFLSLIRLGLEKPSLLKKARIPFQEVGVSAISIRYAELKKSGKIPERIVAKKRIASQKTKIDPQTEDWIKLVKAVEARQSQPHEKIERFLFEANRVLYSLNQMKPALEGMNHLIKKYPKSKLRKPAANLILDTLIANEDWKRTYRWARTFRKERNWKDPRLPQSFLRIESDAYYKIHEEKFNQGDFQEVLSQSSFFLEEYPKSTKRPDWLNLASESAVATRDRKLAQVYLDQIIKTEKNSPYFLPALLKKATLAENEFRYQEAQTHYFSFLRHAPKKKEKLDTRKKILLLTWVSGQDPMLQSLLKEKTVCQKETLSLCQRLAPTAHQTSPLTFALIKKRYLRSKTSSEKAAWGVQLLTKKTNSQEHFSVLEHVSQSWKNLDTLTQFVLTHELSRSVPEVFLNARKRVQKKYPFGLDQKSIQNRIRAVKKVESKAKFALKLPFARIQARVLNEVAHLFEDAAQEIKEIPMSHLAPEEQTLYRETFQEVATSFNQSSLSHRKKALSIASRAVIEAEDFKLISEALSQQSSRSHSSSKSLEESDEVLEEFLEIGPSRGCETSSPLNSEHPCDLATKWEEALKEKRWQEAAYLEQISREKKLFPSGTDQIMNSISMVAVGAQAEGFLFLKDNLDQLDDKTRMKATVLLAKHSLGAMSGNKLNTLIGKEKKK